MLDTCPKCGCRAQVVKEYYTTYQCGSDYFDQAPPREEIACQIIAELRTENVGWRQRWEAYRQTDEGTTERGKVFGHLDCHYHGQPNDDHLYVKGDRQT